MKKIFILLASLAFFSHSFAQTITIIGTEDFEAVSPDWSLNTSDIGGSGGSNNKFIINNAYAGGTFLVGGFLPVTVPATPNQPAAITNSPQSKHLHINAKDAYNAGVYNANYLAGGAEKLVAKMNYDWNTTGKTMFLTFYWLGIGGGGHLYYSTNSGTTWTLADATIYNNQDNWIQKTVTNSAFDNQATLRFAFLFNEAEGPQQDPPLCVDQLELKYLAIATAPDADFLASSLNICAGECIDFTDQTTNSPTSWNWTFDGAATTTSTLQNPINICYNTPGDYTVTLVATNASGSDTETKTSYIKVSESTIPTFSFKTDYCVGEAPASLPASSDNGVNGTWTPATINTSVVGNATYTFTPAAGQCASSLDVIVNSLEIPVASILGEDSICPGDAANLIAQGTGSYSWSDGSSLPQLTVSPDVTTEYTLIVSNKGCNDTTTHIVNLYPEVTAYAGEDVVVSKGGSVNLYASPAVSYEWFPTVFLTCSDCQNPVCTPETSTLYTLTVTDSNGCKATDDIFVQVDEDCEVHGTNVFSPNADGINDVFFLQGNCIKSLEIKIFNRWGNTLFESSDPDFTWDGKHNGVEVPSGVYFYVYKVTFEDGTTESGKSSITLLR